MEWAVIIREQLRLLQQPPDRRRSTVWHLFELDYVLDLAPVAGRIIHVILDGLLRGAVEYFLSLLQHNSAVAEVLHSSHVMRNEEHGPAGVAYFTHFAETFLLEGHVANREDFVNYEDLRI